MAPQPRFYTAPVALGTASLLFGLAVVEKVLNLFGGSIPILDIFPRQVLDWAVTLLIFEIALTLRQLVEMRRQPLLDGHDGAESDVRRAAVGGVVVAGTDPIPAAVGVATQERSAAEHPHGLVAVTRIEASKRTGGIAHRTALAVSSVGVRPEPVQGPLPHVARHIVQP